MPDTTGEENKPEAVGLGEMWLLNLLVKDNQLLTEQSILGDEFGLTACEVHRRCENE